MDVRERKMFRTTVRFLPCRNNGGQAMVILIEIGNIRKTRHG